MSRLSWAPIDSSDARELQELEDELQAEVVRADAIHEGRCKDGWLGEDEDGRPIPCLRCRPQLAPKGLCATCALPVVACREQRSQRRGRCCDQCEHPVSVRGDEHTFTNVAGGRP